MSEIALSVRELRERLSTLPDDAPVYVETIVGGDLGTDDTALVDARVTSDAGGYWLRLLPDPADDYGTRDLIDHAIEAREVVSSILEDHGDCFEGKRIHVLDGDECIDECSGCCADDVIRRLRTLEDDPTRSAPTTAAGDDAEGVGADGR